MDLYINSKMSDNFINKLFDITRSNFKSLQYIVVYCIL